MDKIKTLLVDDEYLALNLLKGFAIQLSMLEIVGKVKSPIQAMEILQQEKVDLLYLDIQMPALNGNQFLRSLKNPPATIFTTAYSEYAVDAFDLGAVDYLLKPFSFERFLQATQKALEVIKTKRGNDISTNVQERTLNDLFLSVKADGKIYRVAFSEILYIEGLKEYLKIITEAKTYITLDTFKNLEMVLPSPQFLRVHKSFMVAKDKVRALDGNMLEVGKATIPISRERKEELVQLIFGK
jgi:two-component system, LytTR family, response regulator LytT